MRRGPKPERGGLQFSLAKSCAVICVTAMLHKIAAKAGVALVEPENIEDDDDENIIYSVVQ